MEYKIWEYYMKEDILKLVQERDTQLERGYQDENVNKFNKGIKQNLGDRRNSWKKQRTPSGPKQKGALENK